jgi:hypothetical protein
LLELSTDADVDSERSVLVVSRSETEFRVVSRDGHGNTAMSPERTVPEP